MDTLANVVEQLPAGWRGRYWPRLSSTQDEARRIVRLGAPTRSIVLADYQTAGRGRQARRWIAPPGTGLLVSMIFREAGRVPIPWRYTTLASVALTQTIECLIPKLQPAIKWPNDIVLLDGAKVAGVLAESTWDGEQLVVIVGVGVNVDVPTQILASIGRAATSLSAAAGEPVDRADLLLGLLGGIDQWLGRDPAELQAAWQNRLWGRGQQLRLVDIDGEQQVIVLGTESDGALVVQLPDGSVRRTTTGELIL